MFWNRRYTENLLALTLLPDKELVKEVLNHVQNSLQPTLVQRGLDSVANLVSKYSRT